MFTGIIENMGIVQSIEQEKENFHFWLKSDFTHELKIDQSVAHNGVCLTVVGIDASNYQVTTIAETLQKTNVGQWKVGDKINLERCMQMNGRLDGHIVQGHVDQIGHLKNLANEAGSFRLTFAYDEEKTGNVTVEKGSICINGISLTVVDAKVGEFSVAIIPYTWEHTNLHELKLGDPVNLEFDIIGKYIQRLMKV